MNFETKELNVMPEVMVTITPALAELGLKGQGTIAAPEVSPEELAEQPEIIKACMVTVGPNAIGHCLDGRGCKECLDGAPTEPGPSVAGGPLTSAYAAAELTGWFGANDSLYTVDKLQALYNVQAVGGIKDANHVDRKAVNANFAGDTTGCGANDKAPLIVAKPFEMKDSVNAGTSICLAKHTMKTPCSLSTNKLLRLCTKIGNRPLCLTFCVTLMSTHLKYWNKPKKNY
jgi:hypothetical protein